MNQIKFGDWHRMFIGEVPAAFYLELVIRAIIIYIILIVSMRLMGKRMSSQLGRNEMAATVTLAAAIGVPLQAPDRGLIPSVVISLIIICIERLISALSFSNEAFEKYSQGNISLLIKDGVLDLKVMKDVRLTRERLVAQLRSNGIKQLGKVSRFYMEANGNFSLIEVSEPKPGLSVLPRWDKNMYTRFKKFDDNMVCQTCGYCKKMPFDLKQECPSCKDSDKWTAAVL